MTKPKLTIVRGLPGSGKSKYARDLSAETGAILIEPDALLVTGGEYQYRAFRYDSAFRNARRFVEMVSQIGCDAIFADVLPTLEDVDFIRRAFVHGTLDHENAFDFVVIDMPLLTVAQSIARNRHTVRVVDIEKMAAAWEPWEGRK